MAKSVLFVCNQNSVRSPMAAALFRAALGDDVYADSAGVYEGVKDPFLDGVLEEIGAPLVTDAPKDMSGVDAASFDLAVALTPEAEAALAEHFPAEKIDVWLTANPSETRGSRDQIVDAYRTVRDDLKRMIDDRFVAKRSVAKG